MSARVRRVGQPKASTTAAREKQRAREIRNVGAQLRRRERPDAAPEILRRAETWLRNRANYNKRRALVRELGRRVRRGEKVEAPPDIMRAVRKHLRYRAQYNRERKRARAPGRRRSARGQRRRR